MQFSSILSVLALATSVFAAGTGGCETIDGSHTCCFFANDPATGPGCDNKGDDIGSVRTNSENCSRECIKKNGCVYFTHVDGVCYFKSTRRYVRQLPNVASVCGFVLPGAQIDNNRTD